MKKFLFTNWYKLMIGASCLMASFGFMIRSITPATANDNSNSLPGLYSNTIHVNADGSINIKLSESQLKTLSPNEVQSVDLRYINGWAPANYEAYTLSGTEYHALGVASADNY